MGGKAAETRTTCPYCGVGCGIIARQDGSGEVSIAGDPDHPANYGRLCSKGSALGETLGAEERLLAPQINGQRASWNAAIDAIASGFSQAIAQHGPDNVALYVSGQILTEDYYVANKWMKGFIGSANIDTNSRLCMASAVAGHRRAFGSDTVPACYEDLEAADLVVLVGSNLAWCHPVLFQRLLAAREAQGTKIIVIDPRRTVTAEAADLHLAIDTDADLPLFLGLLRHLSENGHADLHYLAHHVGDPNPALAAAAPFDVARVAAQTGLGAAEIMRFYQLFVAKRKTLTLFSQGINQSVSGVDKANAIINCHLFTGRIGQPGMGPFSITGQPNAMGGREVGGLANMLAAHLEIENPAHRALLQDFWQAPRTAQKPGLKAIDLFKAVHAGQIKALWIMGTNPADSLPDADFVQEALARCPFLVVSDCIDATDTTRFAHILLPAAAWGEKSGTVTNSERRISRQRSFLAMPGEARPDWWAICQVAQRMGFAGFDFPDPAAIFAEHAALSGYRNGGSRDFDISGHAGISARDYDALAPFQWPQTDLAAPGQARFFGEGGFFTPDRRARMLPTPPNAPVKALSPKRPLWLNSGRIRDQWHTMTRTARAARLNAHYGEPFCEIHPDDAAEQGIAAADMVRVTSDFGTAIVRALVTPRQKAGSIFMPMHWTDRFSARARVNALTDSAQDPLSGQPGFKATPAAIARFEALWYGFAVSQQPMRPEGIAYWALAKAPSGYRLELADARPMPDWQGFAARLFAPAANAEWLAYFDEKAGIVRLACLEGERLIGALFVAPTPVALARGFLVAALGEAHSGSQRLRLLAGRGGAESPDPGAILCACFGVGIQAINTAIAGGAHSLDAIGEAIKAGTNCGSCRSEIKRLLPSGALERTG